MKAKTYRNGWSVTMTKAGSYYAVIVRNARGDVHDKMRNDDYRDALTWWRSFNAIAKTA